MFCLHENSHCHRVTTQLQLINIIIIIIIIIIIALNCRSVIMTLFDWLSLLFIGFVFIISSLLILNSDDYIFVDWNIFRFTILVLTFVVSIMC